MHLISGTSTTRTVGPRTQQSNSGQMRGCSSSNGAARPYAQVLPAQHLQLPHFSLVTVSNTHTTTTAPTTHHNACLYPTGFGEATGGSTQPYSRAQSTAVASTGLSALLGSIYRSWHSCSHTYATPHFTFATYPHQHHMTDSTKQHNACLEPLQHAATP